MKEIFNVMTSIILLLLPRLKFFKLILIKYLVNYIVTYNHKSTTEITLGPAYNECGYKEHLAITSSFHCIKINGYNIKKFSYEMRGPESSLITWSPYKVIIRVLQLVLLYVPVSIGWHHCRTQYVIGPRNWNTVMWPTPIGWWRRVSPVINTTHA